MKAIDSRRNFLLSAALLAASGASAGSTVAGSASEITAAPTKPRLRKIRSARELGKGCQFDQYKIVGGSPSLINGTVYISEASTDKPLPLILYVFGTGQPCSNFAIRDGVVQNAGYSLHTYFQELAGDRARVMVVDNAAVEFGDQSWDYRTGTEHSAREFLENHTLPKWIDFLKAALEAVWQEPWIDSSHTLVCGHSDGATVAARLAEVLPGISHVAPLASGGLCHLLFFNLSKPEEFSHSLAQSLKELHEMESDPNSIDKFYAGFTYRFWTSGYLFLSDFESLARSSARIYAAHGTHDKNNAIEGFDFMCAGLKMLGKDIVVERVEGADHAFRKSGSDQSDGFQPIIANVIKWFF